MLPDGVDSILSQFISKLFWGELQWGRVQPDYPSSHVPSDLLLEVFLTGSEGGYLSSNIPLAYLI